MRKCEKNNRGTALIVALIGLVLGFFIGRGLEFDFDEDEEP